MMRRPARVSAPPASRCTARARIWSPTGSCRSNFAARNGIARRAPCLRTPEKTVARQVAFFRGHDPAAPETETARMKAKIDTPKGRAQYAQRFGAVEPVFGNVRYNKGLDRFTLRGRNTVDGQWKLFCLVHNIEKLAHHGYAR